MENVVDVFVNSLLYTSNKYQYNIFCLEFLVCLSQESHDIGQTALGLVHNPLASAFVTSLAFCHPFVLLPVFISLSTVLHFSSSKSL